MVVCPLRIGQKPNAIEAGTFGRALVQEYLGAASGGVRVERSPVGQICRPLDGVAQARGRGIAELETGSGGPLRIAEIDRRRGNDVDRNRIRGFGPGIVTGHG